MECVYLDAFIQPHYGARLHQILFDGGKGLLGSEIYPGYRKRLVTPGVTAETREKPQQQGGDHGETYCCMSLITNC